MAFWQLVAAMCISLQSPACQSSATNDSQRLHISNHILAASGVAGAHISPSSSALPFTAQRCGSLPGLLLETFVPQHGICQKVHTSHIGC